MNFKKTVGAVVALGLTAMSTNAFATGGFALTTDQRLVRFQVNDPSTARVVRALSGFTNGDTALVGIDTRVQDGALYGVGNNGGIYRISTTNASMTLVNTLTVTLSGTRFGVDFNPAADRLRIISDNGQNLRHNLAGTTLADDALDYAPGTPLNSQGATVSGVISAAYTNNDLNSTTGTTMFVVDGNLNQVALQSPPNNGSLVATGALGVDPTDSVGFDIFTNFDPNNGTIVNNVGYATLLSGNSANLYRVNVLTGTASLVGTLAFPIMDIALRIE